LHGFDHHGCALLVAMLIELFCRPASAALCPWRAAHAVKLCASARGRGGARIAA